MIKRYDYDSASEEVVETENGEYVKYEDYEAELAFEREAKWKLATELEQLKQQVASLEFQKAKVEVSADSSSYLASFPALDKLHAEITGLRKERDALRGVLENIAKASTDHFEDEMIEQLEWCIEQAKTALAQTEVENKH